MHLAQNKRRELSGNLNCFFGVLDCEIHDYFQSQEAPEVEIVELCLLAEKCQDFPVVFFSWLQNPVQKNSCVDFILQFSQVQKALFEMGVDKTHKGNEEPSHEAGVIVALRFFEGNVFIKADYAIGQGSCLLQFVAP